MEFLSQQSSSFHRWKDCQCEPCSLISKRTQIGAEQVRIRRSQDEDGAASLPLPPPHTGLFHRGE